jgi:tRNA-specific 2-thiouridylase
MRVLVGISGGVDSGVAISLLKKRGYQVLGLYLKMHRGVNHRENLERIEKLAQKIGFQYVVEDVEEEFYREVYTYFVESYRHGATPNPCAMCNIKIKFGIFLNLLKKYDCQLGATGHYVRNDGKFLYRAKDSKKDQSYFLFGIKKEHLPRLLFPLGEYTKEEVKKFAFREGLTELLQQKESQDICFIPKNYIETLRAHFNPDLPGGVWDISGRRIGTHRGYPHYTIGQRRGFKLFKAHRPYYVVNIDPKGNRLIVGDKRDLERRQIFLKGVNLFVEKKILEGVEIKVRYRSPLLPAVVKMESRSKGVVFLTDTPAVGVAKGQACVFYQGEKLLGGGWIRGSR